MTIRIGVFTAVAGRQGSGPEIYELELVRKLVETGREYEFHIFCFNMCAREAFGFSASNAFFHVLQPDIRLISLPFSLPVSMLKSGIDFFHATFVPPPFAVKPYLLTQHGSDMFVHPEFFTPRVLRRLLALLKQGFRHARKIICVSRHVADELMKHYPVPAERIEVVYHGVNSRFKSLPGDKAKEQVSRRYQLHKPYILYVGKLAEGKNINRLLLAFQAFLQRTNADVELVLAGKSYPGLAEPLEHSLANRTLARIRRLGQVPQAELPALYSGAVIFVFPTLWEGFGLPVIEAMACGVPVITSRVACLPEIAGDAACLVDPRSTGAITGAMQNFYRNTALREEYRTRGLQRAEQFTWEKTAEQTLLVYEKVMKETIY